MRRLWPAVLLLSSACAPRAARKPSAVAPPVAMPAAPATVPSPPPPKANFELDVSEIVNSSEEDLGSYTKVYVDGLPAGETQIAPRSQDKSWQAVLAPGNHLFRFEQWELPQAGDWTSLDAQWQPPERFIRVELGQKTVVRLKFYDGATKSSLRIERSPLP